LKQIVVIYCKSIFCLNTTPFRGFLLQTLHLFLYNYNSLSASFVGFAWIARSFIMKTRGYLWIYITTSTSHFIISLL
jgi:hypothetical protein